MVAKPTIHLNGTSAESLLLQYRTAIDALRAAEGALEMAAPHGRDYYPQGDSAFTQAANEHRTRASMLKQVREELEEVAEYIAGFVK